MFTTVENKTYAISGSSGFIGKAISKHLANSGCRVIPICREKLESFRSLNNFFREAKPNAIIHLASYGNHFYQYSSKDTVLANVLYTYNIMKAAEGLKVYNVSSSSVSLNQQTLYSITKLFGEKLGDLFRNVINVRPYSVFGPGEADHRFIPTVIRSLNTGVTMHLDEDATHDWIYINDFITALLNGETEIGTGEKYTNLEIVRKLELISGKKLNYTKDKLRAYDNSEWVCPKGVPHMDIDEALLKTYNHYSNDRA